MDRLSKYFQIIELEPGATLDQIKHSYRLLVQVWHPDRFVQNPALKARAEEKLKQINEAYEVLVATFRSISSQEANVETDWKNTDTFQRTADWAPIHTRELFAVLLDARLSELEALLSKGANVNSVADEEIVELDPRKITFGDSLIHLASFLVNNDAVALLSRYGAKVNVRSKDGITPLHIAISKDDIELAKCLVQLGAHINVKDKYGLSPLHYVGSSKLVELLISKGADVNDVAEYYGYTPLHYAAFYNQLEKARLLLARGADSQARGKCGECPLHMVGANMVEVGDEVAEFLVEQGAELDAKDLDGATPLHWAVGAGRKIDWMFGGGNSIIVEFLIRKGANIKARDSQGITPLQLAQRLGRKELIDLLCKYDARETLFEKLRRWW